MVVDVFEVLLARNAWEKRKLGELAKVRTGRAFKSSSFSPNGKYYVVTNKDIGGPQISTHMDGDRIDITNPVDIAKYSLSGRNLLVTMDGVNIGKTAMYSNEDAVLAQRVGRLTSSSLDFVHQITSQKNFLTRMNELSVGNAIKHISLKQISDYAVNVPQQTSERQLIGQTLSLLDNLIAATQRRIDALEQAKKALLQRLFDQSWRFKGYSDPWEKRKWSQLVGISKNMVDPTTGKYDSLIHIGPGNIRSNSRELVDLKTVKDENLISGKFHFDKGDIIYGKINPQLAKYTIAPAEGLSSADTYVLKPKSGIERLFLYYTLGTNRFFKYTVSVSQRTGMPKINRDELNAYSLIIAPSLFEQKRIGLFLRKTDDLIAATQSRLSSLELLKKSLLQDLFI
ncbi:restriction endonuclease subunit S [Lacticaseibacillus paracasei]|uniref:restriction endonuclease subunit S n=1 Tax=Lacticaseibacillus paracasei TaxID=1597 RepID=UPI003AF1A8D1